MSSEDGITSYFMRIYEIQGQLQDLGKIMFASEMTTVALNALLEEWGNFTSSIYGKKEATPFQDIWFLCKSEEARMKAKTDVGSSNQNQAYSYMAKIRGKFGKFGPQKKKKNLSLGNLVLKKRRTWLRFNAMDVKNMGITREIVLSSRRTITKEEEKKPISPKC